MKSLLIKADDTVELAEHSPLRTSFSTLCMQRLIGGDIHYVQLVNGKAMVMRKLKFKVDIPPMNKLASELTRFHIVGDVIVCDPKTIPVGLYITGPTEITL